MNYNIGLDIGTNSVGWAVVEAETGKIIKKNKSVVTKTFKDGKWENLSNTTERVSMWGVRLFEEAQTAKERRGFRSMRRRLNRRRQRIKLLQEEFKPEIDKVDPNFFLKLAEFKYISQTDLKNKYQNILNEKQLNNVKTKGIDLTKEDKEIFNQKYKTIYHLRKELMESKEQVDIRYVYLAIHHLIKYRGNFNYNQSVSNFDIAKIGIKDKLKEIFEQINANYFEMPDYESYLTEIENIILNDSKNDIKVKLKKYFKENNKDFGSEFGKLLLGNEFNVYKLLNIECDGEDAKNGKIKFADEEYETKLSNFGEEVELIENFKQLYDTLLLKTIFKNSNCSTISELMVERYEQHGKNLQKLKSILRDLVNATDYKAIFRYVVKDKAEKDPCLYEKYMSNELTYEEFKKGVTKILEKYDGEQKDKITELLNDENLLPKINDITNGVFPYQLNVIELKKIIENQKPYYPFLDKKVGDEYRLVKLLTFKIPYYVGPLVTSDVSTWAWLERKSNIKITPYNFDEVVDKTKTAQKFIDNMRSHCTYLLDEYALPNNSLLYCEYKVMNELKQIKVNDRKLSLELQFAIKEGLFKRTSGTITEAKFKKYLQNFPDFNDEVKITGYSADKKFANNMQSYVDFFGENGIFTDTAYDKDDAEKIIEWITIFKDKEILKLKLKEEYPLLSEEKVIKILNKNYSGWGNLSKALLTDICYKDPKSNVSKSIIDLMDETKENFMQIINNDEYGFQRKIKQRNGQSNKYEKVNYELVEDLPTSPANKRGIYQSLKIVQEIIDIMGTKPQNIMIEMARSKEASKRKEDRKKYLENLYNQIDDELSEKLKLNVHKKDLQSYEKLDKDNLYLYFLQCGKCMYCGQKIELDELNKCEIDHIIPRCINQDDSLNNRVLVHQECNQKKRASLVVPSEFRIKSKDYWQVLKNANLITTKKYERLIRKEYKAEEIQGFINRQLVETRQITKHVANILENLFKIKVIYLKSRISSNYRKCYELFKFRDLNDFHHAHDAYLAVMLGEFMDKYLPEYAPKEFYEKLENELEVLDKETKEQLKYDFVVNSTNEKMYNMVIKLANDCGLKTKKSNFDLKKFNETVQQALSRNDILVSNRVNIDDGQFYNQTIYKRNKGNISLKKDMPVEIYGGYSSVNTSYMALVNYDKENLIVGIPVELASKNKKEEIIDYLKSQLKIKDEQSFKIIKDRIPFNTLVYFNNQYVYLKSYSEVCNAWELKMNKQQLQEWKYLLNKILNKVKISDDLENYNEKLLDIINYLLSLDNYPLFKNHVQKLKNQNLAIISLEDKEELIKQLLILYNCKNSFANLEFLNKYFSNSDSNTKVKFVKNTGRLNGRTINHGKLIFKSTTGLREKIYEF